MKNCVYCKQQIVRKILISFLEITPSEIAEELHVSKSHISNILAGRRDSEALNKYLYFKIFATN
jgi:hypothetical protein